jgi:predicted nucleic-acid-binding Zn-ribbon protein
MERCVKCGSTKMMLNVPLIDHGDSKIGQLRQAEVCIEANPEAWINKGRVSTPLTSIICADCGFVEIYAKNPQVLYEPYLKAVETLNKSRE